LSSLVMTDFASRKRKSSFLKKVGADDVYYSLVRDYMDYDDSGGHINMKKMVLVYEINKDDGGKYQFEQEKSLLFLIRFYEETKPDSFIVKSVEFLADADYDVDEAIHAKWKTKAMGGTLLEVQGLEHTRGITIYEYGIDTKESFFALMDYISNLLFPHSGIINRGHGFKTHSVRTVDLGNRLDAFHPFRKNYDVERRIKNARLYFRNLYENQ